MKNKILHTSLGACMLMVTVQVAAQQRQTTAFAITSSEKGNFNWTDVKQIDLTTGTVTRSIFDSKQTNFTVYNARTGAVLKPVTQNGVPVTTNAISPVASLAAACAYDQRHNRLYYAPLFMNQLRYIDLDEKEPRIYYFDNEPFMQVADAGNEANHITRMVVGADGDGYALSNDANHLIRFTTGKKPVITDLGPLYDDATNGDKSIHSKMIAWGGDMIADAAGNLYMISAYRNIYKINIQSMVAMWVAEIQGMPETFTTNGAVVDNEGNLIVSSANTAEGYYKVDMKTWNATRIKIEGNVFNASDLANGNLAKATDLKTEPLVNRAILKNQKIALYPNPVSTNKVYLSFKNNDPGKYTIQLLDLMGVVLSQTNVNVYVAGRVVPMNLEKGLAKGHYWIRVLSESQNMVFGENLIVE
jgi:hypothetical protein